MLAHDSSEQNLEKLNIVSAYYCTKEILNLIKHVVYLCIKKDQIESQLVA